MKDINKILIIKWGALGDLIAGTTAIRALRENFPRAELSLLSNKLMYDVCPPGTLIDDIILYEPSSKSLTKNFSLVYELSKRRFDLAVNLRWSSERSAIITWLSRARIRVGSGPKESRWMYSVKAPLYEGRRHEFDRHLDIVRSLDYPVDEPRPFVFVQESDRKFADEFMTMNGLLRSSTLIIHPGASIRSKAWVPERFVEIGKRFARRFHGNIVVTWGREEEMLADQVVNGIGNNALKSPPTTIGKVAALISKAGMCLCNYSGVMNIGMAMETPLLALGCTNSEDWGPYGSLHRTVNTARQYDSYSEAERTELMRQISTDQVWSLLEHRWSELHLRVTNASAN